ncbi:MAG: peptidylprolyl isomerase [Lachnospiraceae bacterium]|nr:peptidylprolyl isomerase [Lachnospiraceae bacterium]
MKKYIRVLLATMLLALLMSGCGYGAKQQGKDAKKDKQEVLATKEPETSREDKQETLSGKHHITIEIADYGTIEAELDADVAPITVTNFVKLAKEGFYDGLTFHRIMSGFMIQGGDPEGTGLGGSEETIKGEFADNGVENNLSHKRGVLSMARTPDPDSASSQFFIVHEDSVFLDGQYAAFGMVTSGMETVDKICEDVHAIDKNGTVPAEKQPKITAIKVVD